MQSGWTDPKTGIFSPIKPLTPQQEADDFAGVKRESWLTRAGISIDQSGNVLFFDGMPDETISSHAARAAVKGKRWGIVLSRFLDNFQKDHGSHAIATDDERAREVEETEEDSGELPK